METRASIETEAADSMSNSGMLGDPNEWARLGAAPECIHCRHASSHILSDPRSVSNSVPRRHPPFVVGHLHGHSPSSEKQPDHRPPHSGRRHERCDCFRVMPVTFHLQRSTPNARCHRPLTSTMIAFYDLFTARPQTMVTTPSNLLLHNNLDNTLELLLFSFPNMTTQDIILIKSRLIEADLVVSRILADRNGNGRLNITSPPTLS